MCLRTSSGYSRNAGTYVPWAKASWPTRHFLLHHPAQGGKTIPLLPLCPRRPLSSARASPPPGMPRRKASFSGSVAGAEGKFLVGEREKFRDHVPDPPEIVGHKHQHPLHPTVFTRSWNTSAQKALDSFPRQNQKPRISFLPSRSIPTATNRVIPCSFPSSVRSLANASMKMVNQSPLRGCVL